MAVEANVNLAGLDPRLRDVVEFVINEARLSAAKAVAHQADEARFPITPDTSALEHVFLNRLRRMSADKRETVTATLLPVITGTDSERRPVFGELAGVDLTARAAVAQQVAELRENRPGGSDDPRDPPLPDPFREIDKKHQVLGGNAGLLGSPTEAHQNASDGLGAFRRYNRGMIFFSPPSGAHEVHGSILQKYSELGLQAGFLGYPVTDESGSPDSRGRFSQFQRGAIYFRADIGAREVHGAIVEKWTRLGSERSPLGYPTSDEGAARDGVGRFNNFESGFVYFRPDTGANAVYGEIGREWDRNDREQGELGFPVSDEMPDAFGGRVSYFQKGAITWNPIAGAKVDKSLRPFRRLDFRLNTVTRVHASGGVLEGDDEILLGGAAIDADGKSRKIDSFKVGDFNDQLIQVGFNPLRPFGEAFDTQRGNEWPKTFTMTLIMAEQDEGGVGDFIDAVAEKLTKELEDKVTKEIEKVLSAAGTGALIGGAVGAVIAAAAAFVLSQVFDWISGAFEDDLFQPIGLSVQVSSPVDTFSGDFETTGATMLREKEGDGMYDVRFTWRLFR